VIATSPHLIDEGTHLASLRARNIVIVGTLKRLLGSCKVKQDLVNRVDQLPQRKTFFNSCIHNYLACSQHASRTVSVALGSSPEHVVSVIPKVGSLGIGEAAHPTVHLDVP
jgi:hypothetical protein